MVINLFFFKIVPPFFKYYFSIPKDHIIYQRKLYIVACCKIILGKNLPFAFFQISLSITKPKENRLPAVPISNLLEKITVPRTVIFLEAIYIRIDFLDVFVVFEGVVEFFKGY